MPTYVLLLNYTDEGMRNIRYLPQHINALRQAVEVAGGRVPHICLTMGQYDVVAIIEAPSDEVCVSISLGLCSVGNMRSTTLKAFGGDDLPKIVENLPSLEEEFSRILSEFRSTGDLAGL